MAEVQSEPTMEDILSSIKKIIAEDTTKGLSAPRARKFTAPEPVREVQEPVEADNDDVLELTDTTEEPAAIDPQPDRAEEPALVSADAETQSRSALESLSSLIVKPDVPGTDTLEGMVREMLRPMLKEWLDANLPRIVEALVSREIARISGKSLI